MKDTEWVVRGLLESLGIGIVFCACCIQEFIDSGKMQDSHGTQAEKVFDERAKRLLCGLDPNVAVCGFENSHSTFCAVLCREKEGLLRLKKLALAVMLFSNF